MTYLALSDWIGRRDDTELDPASIEFSERPATSCRGCLFSGQWHRVCQDANSQAKLRGLSPCEAGVVYVPVAKDVRQIDLLRI